MLIGEVARKSGLSRDTVRFYEREGLISSGEREAGTRTYNDYAPETVERLAFIRQAQRAGFTLREIKRILDEWGDDINAVPTDELIALVEAKLNEIEERVRQLQDVRAYLVAKLERLRSNREASA